MSVQTALPQFKGFALKPEDISYGEAESQDVQVVRNGTLIKVKLTRVSVKVILRGLLQPDVQPFLDQANNKISQIFGGAVTEDMTFPSGKTVQQAVLVSAMPAEALYVQNLAIVPQLELEYHSQIFT